MAIHTGRISHMTIEWEGANRRNTDTGRSSTTKLYAATLTAVDAATHVIAMILSQSGIFSKVSIRCPVASSGFRQSKGFCKIVYKRCCTHRSSGAHLKFADTTFFGKNLLWTIYLLLLEHTEVK